MGAKDSAVVVVRWWGSHFKSHRQARVFAEEFRALRARGWPCHLVLERKPDDAAWMQELMELGVLMEIEPRPRGNFDARCVRAVARLCRRTGAAILHCDNMHTSPLLGAWMARVPVRLWSKRAMNAHFEECRPPTLRDRLAPATRVSCALATRVLAVSSAVTDELTSLGVPERKIWVRHNPRRLGAAARPVNRDEVRRAWGFQGDELVILTVGHAVPVKGWDLLLRAFARFAAQEPRARLVLAGSHNSPAEAKFFQHLRDFAAAQRLEQKVVFTGHLVDVQPAFRSADLFVSPSRSEGFSNVLIEALEAGLPCVSTRTGIAAEVIQPEENGLLVEREDETALAEALGRMVHDAALRSHCARHARVPACIPTLEEYAAQMARDYEALLPSWLHGN